ncbi:MAG: L,D-transpeptidase family protein [Gammaproteobacteria bacterium]
MKCNQRIGKCQYLGVGPPALLLALNFLCVPVVLADTYRLPPGMDSVVGALGVTSTEYEDTLIDIARAYDQGYDEMKLANPTIDPWLPGADTEIVIPSQFILPDAPREGIVINVPEMRLYYFPRPQAGEPRVVVTYPVSVGRQDWKTPHGITQVVAKTVNPAWYPPESIRREHAADGDPLPKMVPPGPDNPLGQYALRLGREGYLIHGTDKPYGIGMRVTHGCLRLYPRDIERLFSEVRVGTKVRIVNQPFKLGWLHGALYLESHPPLDEDAQASGDGFTQLAGRVSHAANGREVDWDQLEKAASDRRGIPVPIGLSSSADAILEVNLE